jgi:hypothetical protein
MAVATTRESSHLPVTSYAVFFIDPAAIGLQRVEAANAAVAELQG